MAHDEADQIAISTKIEVAGLLLALDDGSLSGNLLTLFFGLFFYKF
jgi:hypothetical protein